MQTTPSVEPGDELYFYLTEDPKTESPFSDGGHLPAATVLLYRVCDNDPVKFEEATRLIQLFVIKDREIRDPS